jgi:undecaprenyl-diphosphatase
MNIIQAIILGIVQGLTEFLPISSTAHLTLVGKIMNLIDQPERWTAFIAIIQLGTIAAVIIYFWKDIWNIFISFIKENSARKKFSDQSLNSRLGWFIIIGTIPVVVAGLGFKHIIEGAFTKDLKVISYSLIAMGTLLGIAEKSGSFKKDITHIRWIDSLVIGFFQAMALIPGCSRSGSTITGGLFLGLNRETAARFSFLLSIPAVLASGLLELKESLPYLNASSAGTMIIATIAAAISGYLTIDLLLKFLKKNSTYVFVVYRIALGIIILVLLKYGYVYL